MRSAHSRTMTRPQPKQKLTRWQIAVVIPVVLYALLYLAVVLPLLALYSFCLRLAVWSWWCLRGRDILFVYSDSPVWHDYIEQHILPHLGKRAIVLNWSERKRWRLSLKRMAFYHFGGDREFNPLAVVLRPFRRTCTFRFWHPFRDFKHGRPEELRKMEDEFFALIGIERRDPPT